MAIIKLADNINVTVANKYIAVSSKLDKTADEMKIDATKDNLSLNCLKKICANGDHK
jgi:hypothetical protein